MSKKDDSVIDLDSSGDKADDTIVLNSSVEEDEDAKGNRTITISSSSSSYSGQDVVTDDDDEDVDENYVTSVQSPPPSTSTATTAVAGARVDEMVTSTPVVANNLSGDLNSNALKIQDEEIFEGQGENDEEDTEVILKIVADHRKEASLSKKREFEEQRSDLNDDDDDRSENDEESALLTKESPHKRVRTMEIDEKVLPETCCVLKTDGAIIYLVGTAHFSLESQDDVSKTIHAVQPDVIMMELCKARTNILHLDEETILEEAKNLDLNKMIAILRQDGAVQGVMYLLLLSMSAHLTKELGMAPGGEFRRAWKEAKKIPGCLIHLGDRPINITLKRALASLSIWQKMKLGFNILTSKETITKEDVEKCKQKDLLESMLEEMAGEFPALSKVFVEERDLFLAHSLRLAGDHGAIQHQITTSGSPDMLRARPIVVVGVVGMGHVPGIKQHWNKVTNEDIAAITKIPQPTLSEVIAKKVVKYAFYSAVAYGVFRLARGPISRIIISS